MCSRSFWFFSCFSCDYCFSSSAHNCSLSLSFSPPSIFFYPSLSLSLSQSSALERMLVTLTSARPSCMRALFLGYLFYCQYSIHFSLIYFWANVLVMFHIRYTRWGRKRRNCPRLVCQSWRRASFALDSTRSGFLKDVERAKRHEERHKRLLVVFSQDKRVLLLARLRFTVMSVTSAGRQK